MIPRKQRILLTIIIPILIVVIIGIVIAILLLKTDFMKPSSELFSKYFIQNFDSMNNIMNFEDIESYKNVVKSSNYNVSTTATISSTNDSNNSIEYIADGVVDNTNKQKFNEVHIKQNNEDLINFDFIKQNNFYGIRFLNLKQFISIENSNLKELVQKLGLTEEQAQYIPDNINFEGINLEELSFTEEEINTLANKYVNIAFNNISKDKFSKQRNAIITVNNESLNTNAYQITLSKEEFNNIKIEILEQLKEDEIILGKFDILEESIKDLGFDITSIQLRQEIVESIEEEIKEIKDNNIGTEKTSIIVYEYKGQLVRTTIESDTNKTTIDRITSNTMEKLVIESKKISDEEEQFTLEISKSNNNGEITFDIAIQNVSTDKNESIELSMVEAKVDSTINENYIFKYEKNNEGISTEINNIINLGNISEITTLTDSNNITVNKLEQDQIYQLINTFNEKIMPSITNVISAVTEIALFNNESTVNDNFLSSIDENSVTELQKNRFNSKFEIYAGQEIEAEEVKELVDVIKNNLKGIEVKNSNTLNIYIEKNKTNTELAEKIQKVIQDDSYYNVEIQYDDSTGLVSEIVLTRIVEEE